MHIAAGAQAITRKTKRTRGAHESMNDNNSPAHHGDVLQKDSALLLTLLFGLFLRDGNAKLSKQRV